MKCVVGLGANLGDRAANLKRAIELVGAEIGNVEKISCFHETMALVAAGDDPLLHPNYINAAILCNSNLTPELVLEKLLEIEALLGRVRGVTEKKWQPRLIDLDVIAIDSLILATHNLTVPHPEMAMRRFVLEPFVEIWPEWEHPQLRRTAKELLADLTSNVP